MPAVNITTVELAKEIGTLKDRGYSSSDIARKTGLDVSYVNGILKLLNKGEERLLQAVEKHQIPLSVAITIASSNDKAVQRAMTEAYEKKELRGKALLKARRLIEERRSRARAIRRGVRSPANGEVSSEKLLKAYQQETARQKAVVQKSENLRNEAAVYRVGAQAAIPRRQLRDAAAGRIA